MLKRIAIVAVFSFALSPPIIASNPYEDVPRDTPKELLQEEQKLTDTVEIDYLDAELSTDSAYAVDDELWRQLRRAREYFAQGVAANQVASWEEAQYYLERALDVMAELDIDTVETTPEAKEYNALLSEVVADYRLTLLSLGSLPEDASPSAFLEKFSSMAGVGEIEVEGETKDVVYDVPILFNDKVKKSIIYFQTVAREAFERYLRRSGKYIPLMLDILEQYDLPRDIVYLPLIESGFNCKAYSWARASGPWQFIASTGKLYDLDRNWWYDERRDFVKSTHAAARFLKSLYEQFGSWELALAAYNGGPGRVSRAIEHQRTNNFWDLDLRKQTEDYVPFYMAATIIAKNPELYGFHIDYDDPIAFEEVKVSRSLDLKTVARTTAAGVDQIRELNPELLRDVTPPGVKNYPLRVPAGTGQKLLAALPDMKASKDSEWVRHKIKKGETVSSIANKYGVSLYALLEANNLSRHSQIYAGKHLLVPVPSDAEHVSSEPKDRYVTGENTYVVQNGDNLWEISRSFNTTPEKLRKMNYLGSSSRIYVGQTLKLPGSAPSAKKPAPKDKVKEPVKQEKYVKAQPPAAADKTYVVKKGDTLWDIARRFGTTTGTLRQLNGLSRAARIFIGQKLLLADAQELSSVNDDYMVYIVRRGDTLADIARAFRTTVQTIMQINDISDAKKLAIGTRLRISKE